MLFFRLNSFVPAFLQRRSRFLFCMLNLQLFKILPFLQLSLMQKSFKTRIPKEKRAEEIGGNQVRKRYPFALNQKIAMPAKKEDI